MNIDKQTGLIVAAVAVVVIVVVVLSLTSTTSLEDKRINEELEAKLNDTPEQATEQRPYTPILNPVLVSGEAKVLGMSYYNQGFKQCQRDGARVLLSCEDLAVDTTFLSAPKKIGVDSEEVLAAEFNITGEPGTYRCSFSVVCDNLTVAKSTTNVRLRAQS